MSIILPKVLVIGINAWKQEGDSQTLMEIFRCWTPEKLALIYSRADLPNSKVCESYFQISESEVLKSVFYPWTRVGKVVKNTDDSDDINVLKEHERYKRVHKNRFPWMPLIREIIWKLGHWKSKALKRFISDFDPDILFVPIYPVIYMCWIQKYVIQLTKKPYVCYLADDNYSYDSCRSIWSYVHRFFLRRQIGPIAKKCAQMFVIVDKEKEDTDIRFGTDSIILTKGVDFKTRVYREPTSHCPLRFVYTGSMVIGRDMTLALLADAINRANKDAGQIEAELFIYSQTDPSNDILTRINSGASHFCGRVSRSEVQSIQENADVVVFAESLFGKEANAAKLSFSTKITDYLGNGKCIFAIGKEWIAPIDYFKRNDSAIIATDEEEIYRRVIQILRSPGLVKEYSRKAYDCALRNHNLEVINNRFIQAMLEVSSYGKSTN